MAASPQQFYCLWQEKSIRERLFELLSKEDICAVRMANSACCNLVTKRLFLRTHVEFSANTFTKPCRIQALSRIGHHIEHLVFTFAHSEATFLPPLVHPSTGKEISFLYTPHTSMGSALSRPKYGQCELGEILTQQYPPLFHAATNVPSFINAMKHIPNMRHLTIRTPGQDPRERYRRDVVDYALISLRISIERASLLKLNKLSLSGVHPSAFNYLRHNAGFGCVPSAPKRWGQIRKLYISVEAWDFHGPAPGLDHLKIIDDYIRTFSETIEKFTFTWLGRKGPCPLALAGDPLFARPRSSKKLFNEVTSPMSPLPPAPGREPIYFPRLRYMQVRNATMSASQMRELVDLHRCSVREFDFENVALTPGDSWDEALAPLKKRRRSTTDADVWSQTTLIGNATDTTGSGSDIGSVRTAVNSSSDVLDLPTPSAAVTLASKELLETDLEQFVFGESGKAEGVEQWRQGVGATDPEHPHDAADCDDRASDVAAAKEASQSFSTNLKKRRIRKRSKKSLNGTDYGANSEEEEHRRHHRSRSRHQRSQSDETEHRHRSHSLRHFLRRHRSEELPPPLPELPALQTEHTMPEVVGADDESFRPSTPQPLMKISAPVLKPNPTPSTILLQPTVYDPAATPAALLTSVDLNTPPADGLSSVQRGIEAELRLAEAEAAAARVGALRRAKEAVLTKLSREFCRRASSTRRAKESAAVSGLAALGCCSAAAAQSSSLVAGLGRHPYFAREGSGGGGGWFGGGGKNSLLSVVSDHRSLESQTALVPLMFSRA